MLRSRGGEAMKLLPRVLPWSFFCWRVAPSWPSSATRSRISVRDPSVPFLPNRATKKQNSGWSRLRHGTANFVGFRGGGSWSETIPRPTASFSSRPASDPRRCPFDGTGSSILNSDDIFNWPWVYAVQVQTWAFNEAQAERMRNYLLKGGFLMVDDFHGGSRLGLAS